MSDFVKNMLHDAADDMDQKTVTPGTAHLFKVNKEDPKPLQADKKEIFIHLVMKRLYLTQPTRATRHLYHDLILMW